MFESLYAIIKNKIVSLIVWNKVISFVHNTLNKYTKENS